jgi:diguanylate cyclase (GGDEF)-like protein
VVLRAPAPPAPSAEVPAADTDGGGAPDPLVAAAVAGPRPGGRTVAALVGAAVALSLLWNVGNDVVSPLTDGPLAELGHGAFNAALQTLGAVLLWRGSTRTQGRRRVAWTVIACGATTGAIGSWMWSAVLARTGHHPQEVVIDAIYASALVLTSAGVALVPPTTERSLRLRAVDAAILMVTALTLVWVLPVHQLADGSVVAGFSGLDVNQIVTVLTILVAVGAIARCRPDRQGEVAPMAAALAMSGVGMLMYASSPEGYPVSSQLADTVFVVGFVLAAVSGARLAGPPKPPRRRGSDLNGHWLALPEAATVVTLVALTLHERWEDSPTASIVLGATAVALAIARLLQLGIEQRRLSSTLQASAEQLHHDARTDALTGLGNRLGFDERLRTQLEIQARTPAAERRPIAVTFVDVDHFKRFNDALGHAVGDGLLVEVARRLVANCGEHVYRIGGDEFVAVSTGDDTAAASAHAAAVIDAFAQAVVVDDHEMSVSVSAGVAVWDELHGHPPDAHELVRCADLALYRSKELGRGTWTTFDPRLAERAARQHELRTGLQRALDADELHLDLEPVVRLRSHRLVGATARLRWPRGDSELDAATISAVAVEGGLVAAVVSSLLEHTRRVLVATAEVHTDRSGTPLWIEVPLTRDELVHPVVRDLVARTVADPRIGAERLRIGVTEATVVDPVALEALTAIRTLGVHVTVEQFGTGPSSLLTMDDYPADAIRLDPSFVEGLGRRRDDTVVVTTVTSLATELGLEVSADGIGEEFPATYLDGLGVATGRGRAFGVSMDLAMLRRSAGRVCWADPEPTRSAELAR